MKATNKRQARALTAWRQLSPKQRSDMADYIFDDASFHLESDPNDPECLSMCEASLALVRLLEALDRSPERNADWVYEFQELLEGDDDE